jgi:hypothetical protein
VQEVRQDRLANSIRQVRSLLAANLIPAARPTLPKWDFGSHNDLLRHQQRVGLVAQAHRDVYEDRHRELP